MSDETRSDRIEKKIRVVTNPVKCLREVTKCRSSIGHISASAEKKPFIRKGLCNNGLSLILPW